MTKYKVGMLVDFPDDMHMEDVIDNIRSSTIGKVLNVIPNNRPRSRFTHKTVQNPGKNFWTALNTIVEAFKESTFPIPNRSFAIPGKVKETLNKLYPELEKSILDTWEDAVQLADDLEEMKWLNKEDGENFRKSCQTKAESILSRLENFVDNDKIER